MSRIGFIVLACITLSSAALGGPTPRDPLTAVRSIGLSKSVKADDARIVAIVSEAIQEGHSSPLFEGPKAAEATAMLLLGAAFHESGLKESVETCAEKGDHGFAYGLPQMHAEHFAPHTVDEVCASRRLQWKIQAKILAQGKRWCKSVDPLFVDKGPEIWLANYHSGNRCEIDGVSAFEYRWFVRLCRDAGIAVYRHNGRWTAS